MKIAICDDEQRQVDYLRGLISKWASDYSFKAIISEYHSAKERLFKWVENNADILLLDIQMTGQKGMGACPDISGIL